MQRLAISGVILLAAAVGVVGGAMLPTPAAVALEVNGAMIVHNVYFSLNESSAENRAKLVAACKKYLTDHEGVTFFAAGIVGDEFDRPVNDRDYDVALHLVFRDKAAHDKYQDDPRHLQFIEENKAGWKKVRVFDSVCE